MGTAALLAIALVAYSLTMNLWPPFNGPAYVPLNILLTVLVVVLMIDEYGLSAEDIGWGLSFEDTLFGAAIAVAVGAVLLLLALPRSSSELLRDERVAHLKGRALAYQTLLRVPVGTALAEEILFRGVLFAAFQEADMTVVEAALLTSAAFGLWHISPTINLVRANYPDTSRGQVVRTVVGGILLTTLAGLGLTWLRVETGSLLAPFLVHAGVNSLATVASVLASRRYVPRHSTP